MSKWIKDNALPISLALNVVTSATLIYGIYRFVQIAAEVKDIGSTIDAVKNTVYKISNVTNAISKAF